MSRAAGGRAAPLLIAVSLTLVAADHAGGAGPAVDRLRTAVRGGLAGFEAAAVRPFVAVAGTLGRADDLARENTRLRRALARQRSRAMWADALARDNVALAALNRLSAPGNIPAIAARVVAPPAGRPGSALLIDRGTAAGVDAGMAVVAAGTLVGRVVSASPAEAAVLPLTDPAMAVAVRLADSGELGMVEGSGRSLRLALLAPGVRPRAGSLVVTAGVAHGRFPPALPVGRVGGGRHLAVEPAVSFTALDTVQVLAWRPGG